MAPTAHIPISKPGHFGINMSAGPIKKRLKTLNPYKLDCLHFDPETPKGAIFTLEMDKDSSEDIPTESFGYVLDVHDFNLEEWQRNMSRRQFKCEDVMEYIVETFNWKRSLQAKYQPGDIFQLQDDVTPTMRYDCVNWLAVVTRKMDFTLETFCLAVNFLDRFLCIQPIEGNCLQLAGLAAFFIASKQEEVDPPQVSELVTLCGGAFQSDKIQNAEKIILTRLNYDLLAPTSGFFLELMAEVSDELDWPVDLARHLVEMTMSDPVLAQLRPLLIANGVRQIIKACPKSVQIGISINCPKCDPYCEKDDLGLIEICFENLVKLLLQCEKNGEY